MTSTMTFSLRVTGTTDAYNSVNDRINKAFTATSSTATKLVVQDISLEASEVDHVVDFGEITSATMICVFSDKDLSIKLNSDTGAKQIGKFFVASGNAKILSAKLTNTATAVATVQVVLLQ